MIKAIVFDLGGVLVDWHPEHLYKTIFNDEAEMRHFLNTVCTGSWNEEQDGGRSLEEGTEFLVRKFPEHEENIRAFYGRWEEMLAGTIEGTVEIFKRLRASGKYQTYALTNWSAETFPIAQKKYDFLNWFDGVVVSGTEKISKPDPAFFQILLDRHSLKIDEIIFIDDNLRNVEAARKMGVDSIQYTSPDDLLIALKDKGIEF